MVNSVYRAAEILSLLSTGKNRITDIGKELNLSKSTTHRLLKTLENCGFVFQDPVSHQYFLGHLIIELSSNPLTMHQNLIVCAYEEMKRLREVSGETVTIHIRIGMQRICLEEMQANQNIRYGVGKGSVSPIYAGSAGKILLAELTETDRSHLIRNIRLTPVGPHTITDRNKLLREIEKIEKQGYAISSGETLEGAISISVPVKAYFCPVALSIFGPKFRLGPRILSLKKEMERCAKRIGTKIKDAG
jgi:DNA-binding IclR family transcriptional regulator